MSIDKLIVRGAREHNLKDVSIELPREALIENHRLPLTRYLLRANADMLNHFQLMHANS